jgi:hypothetical protein
MVACAYCDRPLICNECQAEYRPPSPEAYESLSCPEATLVCPECEAVIVCHWCKTPYDGTTQDEATGAPGGSNAD